MGVFRVVAGDEPGRPAPVRGPELGVGAGQMVLDGARRDSQGLGDGLVAEVTPGQAKTLHLAPGQSFGHATLPLPAVRVHERSGFGKGRSRA